MFAALLLQLQMVEGPVLLDANMYCGEFYEEVYDMLTKH
jgi:hypothetical protein